MIKKIRRKFIIVAMVSIFGVLFSIISIINISSYHKINKHADEILTVLEENGGKFPKPKRPFEKGEHLPPNMSPEAPFETRYFSVVFDNSGNIYSSDTGYIAAISKDNAVEYALKAYNSNKTTGFFDNYKYKKVILDDSTFILFLDCSRDLDTFHAFLAMSILVSLFGILLVFLLVLVLSKIAIRPIAESYEKQKRFITDASHEIKTPLTIIDANTEIAEMKDGETKWTKSTRDQVKRLTELTNTLVAFARMDEGNSNVLMTEFSLSNAVLETAEPFIPLIEMHEKQIYISIHHDISYLGDEKALRQLVSILIDNAIKYSSENANIILTLEKSGKKNIITISNPIDSIKIGNHDEFFDRFYRGEPSRNTAVKGYGIGLSLAKSIVLYHKGKISAKSVDGKSLTITVTI